MRAMGSGVEPPTARPVDRPATERWLARLLLLEFAVAVLLVGLSLLGALAAGLALRSHGASGLADLALAVLLVVAAAAAALAALDLAAWLAVRRRRGPALPLAVLAQLLLLPLVVWLVRGEGPGRILTAFGLLALAVAGLVLALGPASRGRLRRR